MINIAPTESQIEQATDAVWKALNEERPIALSKAECRRAAVAVIDAAGLLFQSDAADRSSPG